jgi:hypothetical protein
MTFPQSCLRISKNAQKSMLGKKKTVESYSSSMVTNSRYLYNIEL